ncbi:hypothetical protein FisN_11Lh286 [Fistulifera solaris]|uniref:Transcription initiation factor TFIID subunit 8 n=1 Tax=Fistulifera solaris TaxID=1519565 RepID=A0A1Z5K127_FISSO|nr:hypothetical protein FisN_11Lh286 [Fistulifera solaris]|eukprot:GAX19842.1 hypothetical protein FisN_11Lh286 [Fistulifera solaris]
MQHASDDIYCALIARRAVARAALHLGIADMTAEALDVLGDILLEFLNRLGQSIGYTVEASGRSSAHVHVLDALRAVEFCTTTAVTQIHFSPRHKDDHLVVTNTTTTRDTSWKGLATFLLGPDWMQEENNVQRSSERTGGGGGGKVGPRSTAHAGWHAPYPEEIPYFPIVANPALIANPHSLQPKEELQTIVIEQKTKKYGVMSEVSETIPVSDNLPETLFQTTWGSLLHPHENQKRKRENETEESVSKKVKLTDNTIKASKVLDLPPQHYDYYLPSYYPPLPRTATPARTIVVEAPSAAQNPVTATNLHGVRSSLVQWNNKEWGTIAEEEGRGVGGVEGPTVTAGMEDVPVQPHIVPLGRASGSRVSRILEGSMEMGT